MEALSSYIEDGERYSPQELGVYGADFAEATTSRAARPRQWSSMIVTDTTSNAKLDLRNVTRLSSEIDVTLARLRSFKAWGDNWDGEGSPAPELQVIDSAVELYALLLNTRLRFRAMLGGDGAPLLLLKHSDFNGEIVVEAPGTISCVFKANSGDRVFEEFDVPFNRVNLPEGLKQFLESIRS